MKILIELPVIVKVDNVEALFMASSIATTSHTKHMDIRYKCVNKYVEDEIVKMIFVHFAENVSNILNKNISAKLNQKNSKNMIGEKPK